MPSLARCLDGETPYNNAASLSKRELDVLKLLAVGKSSKEISAILGIRTGTVDTYRSRVRRKIDSSSLADLIHYAIRHEIVKLRP
jgi:two-component system, NarL family, invasion response regulator UvrY